MLPYSYSFINSLRAGHRVPLTMCNPWMTCWLNGWFTKCDSSKLIFSCYVFCTVGPSVNLERNQIRVSCSFQKMRVARTSSAREMRIMSHENRGVEKNRHGILGSCRLRSLHSRGFLQKRRDYYGAHHFV